MASYESWSVDNQKWIQRGEQIRSTRTKGSLQLDLEVDNSILDSDFQCDPKLNEKVCLWQGDITQLAVDAIVNAARPSLLGGGGIDGAIHRAAGPQLREYCAKLNGCKHGETKISPGFSLPCKFIFHTVGPNRDLHQYEESFPLLESSYLTCLKSAVENDVKTIAFSCISTGAYRFPNREGAHVALATVRKWLEKTKYDIHKIVFCVNLDEDLLHYSELFSRYFPCQ